MKTIAYLDCPSGIAGDMCLAALVDAGVPLDYLQAGLEQLGLSDEFTLTVMPTQRRGLRALAAQVVLRPDDSAAAPAATVDQAHAHAPEPAAQGVPASHPQTPDRGHSHPTRHLPAIERLIDQANLPDRVRRWSLAIFRHLAEAEAAVHGIPVDQVHFHEVGATDAIVDIVGTCLGLDYLQVDTLICSPLPIGRGRVRAAHGWLPVPAPAVLTLLERCRVPVYSNGLQGELVTPTGAAIATTLATAFGDPPPMTIQRTGLGAGGKDLPIPNILRLWLGTAASDPSPSPAAETLLPEPDHPPYDQETIVVLETQVDDMLPQAVGYLGDRLLSVGALDVFTQPLGMKKSRPGLLITVLCRPDREAHCLDQIFAETPTLGVRRQTQQRWVLPRQIITLQTTYGPVALKLAFHPTTRALLNAQPEYEDCATLARQHRVPWQTVHQAALQCWHRQSPAPQPDCIGSILNPHQPAPSDGSSGGGVEAL